MKKIKEGKSGEINAEVFETWFPDKPEVVLMDFLKTGNPKMICVKKLNETDVGITTINREYAQRLLDEFKFMRKQNGK